NCGTCGKSCPLDRECSNGACTCMNGRSDCGTCVDLNQDSRNCGACGTTCDGSAFCESGACRCRTGYKECGGTCIPESQQGITCNGICVNPQTDTGNCGECNHKCSDTYPTCTNGVCVGGGGCFIETTAVATYDSFVPISLIQAGDRIPGYDTSTGHVINRTITEVLIHRNEAVLRLEFTNDTIICTPIQPFYTGTWTPASELVAGDRVLCRDNHWEVLVNDPLPAGERDVYNLHGSPNQSYYTSYFVGRSQLLVHNMKVAKG
ncbi:MAG TPA: polymorphic toxin-type HINT domain-containing protein, partial [Methanoregula sp.]|nr:polymorphic toxin-type HINT domain-containing protein [Methanoregula sp.]